MQACVPNAQWGQKNWNISLEQREGYCRAKQGEWVACALQTPGAVSPEHFQRHGGWGGGPQGMWSARAQFSGWWWSILRHQKV